LAGEIGEDTHHERQLLHLDGAAGLDIIRDVDSRLSNAADLFLGALARHGLAPRPAVPRLSYPSKHMSHPFPLLPFHVPPAPRPPVATSWFSCPRHPTGARPRVFLAFYAFLCNSTSGRAAPDESPPA